MIERNGTSPRPPAPLTRIDQLTSWGMNAAAVMAVGFMAMYVIVALLRLKYPFELEWMEGEMVDHVARVLHGMPIYVPPSLEFVPAIYTPLYFYVSALVASITGLGFLPLRILSFASSLGCFALIFMFVKRETERSWPALIAAGLFAATYVTTGTFFDLARIDSFALFVLLLGIYLLHHAESPGRLILAALLLALSFFAKQSALPVIAIFILYEIYVARIQSLWFVVALILFLGAGTLVMDVVSGGWFKYYVIAVPQKPAIEHSMIVQFWLRDLMKYVPVLCLCCAAYLFAVIKTGRSRNLLFLISLLAGFTAASFMARIHVGGYTNVLMLVYAAVAIGTGLTLASAARLSHAFRWPVGRVRLLLVLAVIGQFARLWYNPVEVVPNREMTDAGRQFVNFLAQAPGDVYLPYHGFLPTLAGKNAMAHQQPNPEMQLGDSTLFRTLADELNRDLVNRRFSLIVLDQRWNSPTLETYYELIPNPMGDSVVYHPWTGGERFRPRYWYIPRQVLQR